VHEIKSNSKGESWHKVQSVSCAVPQQHDLPSTSGNNTTSTKVVAENDLQTEHILSSEVHLSSPCPGGSQLSEWRSSHTDRDNFSEDSTSSDDEDNCSLTVDPGLYAGKRVNEQVIKLLLNQPCHPPEGFIYPKTDGRQCSRSCFYGMLNDKSKRR